jgi:hypothetical protein
MRNGLYRISPSSVLTGDRLKKPDQKVCEVWDGVARREPSGAPEGSPEILKCLASARGEISKDGPPMRPSRVDGRARWHRAVIAALMSVGSFDDHNHGNARSLPRSA